MNLLIGLTAFIVAAGVTPVLMYAMKQLRMVDWPDGERKLHHRVVPLGGGIAIWLALVIPLGIASLLGNSLWPTFADREWSSMFVACALLCVLGLADDAWNLRGRQKLIGQLIALSVLIEGGLVIPGISLFGWQIELGVFAVPFTLFWLLGAVNAINMLDGIDGLAAIVGSMMGYTVAVLAIMQGQTAEAALTIALAGGTLGFLLHNFPPARIFLGESGSTLIGLVLGVVAIRVSMQPSGTVALAAPLAIWTLPVLDISMAILRRKLSGRSIYVADRAHLHHRLNERGLGPRQSLLLAGSLCAVTTAGALASVLLEREWPAVAATAAVVAFLVVSGLFGRSELLLLARRGRAFAQSLLPLRSISGREHQSHIQGTFEWHLLWKSLVSCAQQFQLDYLELSINVPSMHEQFFASWSGQPRSEIPQPYRADIPLTCPPFGSIGTLRIVGSCPTDSACARIAELIEAVRPFEPRIGQLLAAELQRRHTGGDLPLVLHGWRVRGGEIQPIAPLIAALAADSPPDSIRRESGDSAA